MDSDTCVVQASAVTVLSAEDPVRAFQNFATLDLLSRGRAEMIVGRGSSIEAFPLFGFNLDDYFDAQRGPNGALLVGSPDEVTEKVLRHAEALGGISRISFQMNVGSLPQSKTLRAIDAIGARVLPALHDVHSPAPHG